MHCLAADGELSPDRIAPRSPSWETTPLIQRQGGELAIRRMDEYTRRLSELPKAVDRRRSSSSASPAPIMDFTASRSCSSRNAQPCRGNLTWRVPA